MLSEPEEEITPFLEGITRFLITNGVFEDTALYLTAKPGSVIEIGVEYNSPEFEINPEETSTLTILEIHLRECNSGEAYTESGRFGCAYKLIYL